MSNNVGRTVTKGFSYEAILWHMAYRDIITISVDEVKERSGVPLEEVRRIVNYYPNHFKVENDIITIISKSLPLCEDFVYENGCSDEDCRSLHMCVNFIVGKCVDVNCQLNHNWHCGKNRHWPNPMHHKYLLEYKIVNNYLLLEWARIESLSHEKLNRIFEERAASIVSKLELDICNDYNKGNCKLDFCPHLHICIFYLAGICSSVLYKDCFENPNYGEDMKCSLDHTTDNPKVKKLLKIHKRKLATNLREIYPDLFSYSSKISRKIRDLVYTTKSNYNIRLNGFPKIFSLQTTLFAEFVYGDVPIPEICSIQGTKCNPETSTCLRLHSSRNYCWQMKYNDLWINFRSPKNQFIEEVYCKPNNDFANVKFGKDLTEVFGDILIDTEWKIDFQLMKMSNFASGLEFMVRRLTLDSEHNIKKKSNTFVWYMCLKNRWVTQNDVSIENEYKEFPTSFMFVGSKTLTSFDFANMTAFVSNTKTTNAIRRRPLLDLSVNEHYTTTNLSTSSTPSVWKKMKTRSSFEKISLDLSISDYKYILNQFIHDSDVASKYADKIKCIYRLQSKVHLHKYGKGIEKIENEVNPKGNPNIKNLFYGVSTEFLEVIYLANIDNFLIKPKHPCPYGKGAYFTKSLEKALEMSPPDANKEQSVIIANVAVGLFCEGKENMTCPPLQNPEKDIRYHTTTDSEVDPTIFVKYDKNHYCPQYVIIFR